jgi:hypothetical protein
MVADEAEVLGKQISQVRSTDDFKDFVIVAVKRYSPEKNETSQSSDSGVSLSDYGVNDDQVSDFKAIYYKGAASGVRSPEDLIQFATSENLFGGNATNSSRIGVANVI